MPFHYKHNTDGLSEKPKNIHKILIMPCLRKKTKQKHWRGECKFKAWTCTHGMEMENIISVQTQMVHCGTTLGLPLLEIIITQSSFSFLCRINKLSSLVCFLQGQGHGGATGQPWQHWTWGEKAFTRPRAHTHLHLQACFCVGIREPGENSHKENNYAQTCVTRATGSNRGPWRRFCITLNPSTVPTSQNNQTTVY